MPSVVILPRAEAQIVDVLHFTLEEFGESKYLEYRELIGLALQTLEAIPTAGKHRPDIHPDAWTYHIARPGRRARHMFLYRIRDAVEIARFLYDAMNLPRQRPRNGNESRPSPAPIDSNILRNASSHGYALTR